MRSPLEHASRWRLLAAVLALVLVAAACDDGEPADGTTTSTSPEETVTTDEPDEEVACEFEGDADEKLVGRLGDTRLLTDIRVTVQPPGGPGYCFDVVTFEFEPGEGGTPRVSASYEEGPILEDASGEPVDVEGEAFLVLVLQGASAVDLSGEEFRQTYTGTPAVPAESAVRDVENAGDFESVLTWAIGLDEEFPFSVELEGDTVVVKIDAAVD